MDSPQSTGDSPAGQEMLVEGDHIPISTALEQSRNDPAMDELNHAETSLGGNLHRFTYSQLHDARTNHSGDQVSDSYLSPEFPTPDQVTGVEINMLRSPGTSYHSMNHGTHAKELVTVRGESPSPLHPTPS